jgi:pectate disaccharide-lyase
MIRISQILIILLLITSYAFPQTTCYVDPIAGLDTNPGTLALPLKTIAAADTKVGTAGGYIYLRGGTYSYSSTITLSKIASAQSTIKIWAYNNEIPLIDFAGETGTSSDGIKLSGDYYHLRGLEIVHAAHNGIACTGHNNIIEACKIHSNRNSGFQMGGGTNYGYYPSNNLILNCDSYLNFDAPTTGGNADGFSPKWFIGKGNVFRGCRAWQNSDDGWDLWMADSTVEIDSCFSFRNGVNSWGVTLSGNNGNGFKLGGNYVATPHIVKNCISFDNAGDTGRGFDENNDTAGLTLYNCVAYRNLGDNYHFTNNPITGHHIIKNCISYTGNIAISNATLSNNSWPSLTPTAADFVSLDTTLASAPRQANGNLPDNGFFRLKAGSKFIDAGTNVGIPFMGAAPDIGAFEYSIINLNLTALIQGFTNPSTGQMVPDTISCIVKNGSAPFTTADSTKVLLNTNGAGTATFSKVSLNANYYIQIKHRNAIETWSNSIVFANSNPSYNFTTSQSQAYGNNLIQIGSKWCLYNGDVNRDGIVDSGDLGIIDNDNANYVSGYTYTDVNGDGIVDSGDLGIVDNNNANYIGKVTPPGGAN